MERGQEQLLIRDYGQSLANLAANRAVDATLNHDLVSLQVILQDIMENPRALLASIHDVENQLLVQAGSTKALTHAADARSFTAPIPLQDSIAGYVTVNIESQMPEIKALYMSFAALCALLVVVALLSLLNRRGPIFTRVIAQPAAAPRQPEPIETLPEAPVVYTAKLRWHWQNLDTLRQQISAQRLEDLFNQVETLLVEAVKIVGAQCQTRRHQGRQTGEYWITYASGENPMVAYYQLIVCAHLIHQGLAGEKLKLVFASTIGASDETLSQYTSTQHLNPIICLLPDGTDEEWDDWIYYNELPEGLQLMGFVPPLDDEILELSQRLDGIIQSRCH